MKTICESCKHQDACGHTEVEACANYAAPSHWADAMPTLGRTESSDSTVTYRSEVVDLSDPQDSVNRIDPIPGIPMVRVLDENGVEILRGWYVRHKNRQPGALGDCLHEEDVDHVVAYSDFADWNMPKDLKFMCVTPPHRIEVIL